MSEAVSLRGIDLCVCVCACARTCCERDRGVLKEYEIVWNEGNRKETQKDGLCVCVCVGRGGGGEVVGLICWSRDGVESGGEINVIVP